MRNNAQFLTHAQRVRLLYKTILKLHRGLPLELQALGDQYTKDEFRRHKYAEEHQMRVFMEEWTNYAINLVKQLGLKGSHLSKSVGKSLTESDLDKFSEDQLHQLYSLYKSTKPSSQEEETNK